MKIVKEINIHTWCYLKVIIIIVQDVLNEKWKYLDIQIEKSLYWILF
jgi:hypothetical protein